MIDLQPNIRYQQAYPPKVQPPLRVIVISVAECSGMCTGEDLYTHDRHVCRSDVVQSSGQR